MTAFPWILDVIRQYSLHTQPTMMDQVPAGVRREYGYWYGEEMLDGYHLEFQTLLWIPWSAHALENCGSLLFVSQDHYELHSFRQEDGGVWKNMGPREAEAVAAIHRIYGPNN